MKTQKQFTSPSYFINLILIFILSMSFANAQDVDTNRPDSHKPETEMMPAIYWDVKAYLPDARLIKVKAIDKDGNMHNVKAIQNFYDTSILDVKAIVDGEHLPVKLIVDETEIYFPLKAISNDGTLFDIMAITEENDQMPIKGIGKSGNIVYIKVIDKDNSFYKVFAISPKGIINDIKGIKLLDTKEETTINDVSIYAHVKALKQN
ncbi:DUF7486 family protein [Algibacter sp.]|uniref:DUF7486 family protein n=1 Tax=Algibacter sp. TaxID=1872428 RepID=UPI003C72E187